jgi:serine/threonine protein kinase/tetratricopeptide (TPR) repeat protein
MLDVVGRTLGKYHIVDHLGRGGMAEVYKAYQPNLDRYVAVKLMHPHLAAEADFIGRFEREAKNVAALRHPNIVQVYDYDVEQDTPYMVMEFIEGGTLKAHLEKLRQRGDWLTVSEAVRLVREVGQALAYAHGRGMVHRDVKSANVMVDTGGRAILTDFGIAKMLASTGSTATGAVMGTPAYMAPEQGMGNPGDARSDLYSLGVMMFEMLTGRLPYEADTPLAVILKHINDPLPNPRALAPSLPEPLERVLFKALAKNPDDRFQAVDEMLARMEEALSGIETQPTPGLHVTAAQTQPHDPDATPLVQAAVSAPGATGPGKTTSPTKTLSAAAITLEIKAPPEPTIAPKLGDFVGREAELAALADKLQTDHLALVCGMPGVGKTSLAAALALRAGEPARTFWHSFHAGEGVNALLWKLAGFLHWHNQPDLWHMLQAAQQTGSQPPPTEVLFDYLFQMLKGQNYLLCLDDFHFVEEDPLLEQFIGGLQDMLGAGEVSIILTSRHLPGFAAAEDFSALTGLSEAGVRQLLIARGLSLSDDLIAALYARTEGNPQLLTLALDTLRRGKDPARLIRSLSESEHMERFLMKEVDEGLSEEEREVMSGLAVLAYPGTRDALTAVLDGASVRRTLTDLVSRYLVLVAEGDYGREYSQHALVQSFYYDLLEKRERQAMHQRAAAFYENEEPDPLRAARHSVRAGQEIKAAQLVTADVWAIVNRGQARPLRQLLAEDFAERGLPPELWASILLARGQVYALLGETMAARASYDAALNKVSALPDSPAVLALKARVCLGLGELLQDDTPPEALEWLNRGLNVLGVGKTDARDEAALFIRKGVVQFTLGHAAPAVEALQDGLALLSQEASALRATALNHLGIIALIQGDTAQGRDYLERALEMERQLNNYWGMATIWHNIGFSLEIEGRWAEAAAYFQQEREMAERLGSVNKRYAALLGQGLIELKLGNDALAEDLLSQCLQIARHKTDPFRQLVALDNLADLYVRCGRTEDAVPLLAEADQLAQTSGTGRAEIWPELYRNLALVRLARGQAAEALEHLQRSLEVARESKADYEEGMSLRALGQVQHAQGQREAALASFEQSVALLADRSPYEAARTKLVWGLSLRAAERGEAERRTALLREARETFQQLDAKRDLASAEEALAT